MSSDNAALEGSLVEFFEGIVFDHSWELTPLTATLEDFGEQTNERHAGDRASVEYWIIKRLMETNPGYVRQAEKLHETNVALKMARNEGAQP